MITACDHLSAQVLRYFLRAAFTAAVFFAVFTAFALAFGVGLSCGVKPIGRLCGSGATISSRSASITCLSCARVLRLNVSCCIASDSVFSSSLASSASSRLAKPWCVATSSREWTMGSRGLWSQVSQLAKHRFKYL